MTLVKGAGRCIESIDLDVPAPIIASSLYRRFDSRQQDGFCHEVLSAMRNKFGGHAIKEKK
jgi:6-phosphogluconate dehydrogenase